MIHRGLLFWSLVAVGTAVGLFAVKYKVQDLEEKIDRTNQKIIEAQKATHILRVEWAHLNEAERIQRLAEKYLKLEPASIKQVIQLDAVKVDPAKAELSPPATQFATSFPPTYGHRRPLVDLARWRTRRSGGRQPLAGLRTPFSAFLRTHDAPSTGHSKRASIPGSGWRRPECRRLDR